MPINVETDVITCMRDIGNDHFFFPTVSQTKNERSACRAKIQIVRIFQGNWGEIKFAPGLPDLDRPAGLHDFQLFLR